MFKVRRFLSPGGDGDVSRLASSAKRPPPLRDRLSWGGLPFGNGWANETNNGRTPLTTVTRYIFENVVHARPHRTASISSRLSIVFLFYLEKGQGCMFLGRLFTAADHLTCVLHAGTKGRARKRVGAPRRKNHDYVYIGLLLWRQLAANSKPKSGEV